MSKRFLTASVAILICIAAVVVFLGRSPPRVRGAFMVTFLHYTNDAKQTNLAVVRFSNQSDYPFRYLGQYNVFPRGAAAGFCGATRHKPHTLRPGESETLTVSVGYPTHRGAWSAHFLCIPTGLRFGWYRLAQRLRIAGSTAPNASAETSVGPIEML